MTDEKIARLEEWEKDAEEHLQIEKDLGPNGNSKYVYRIIELISWVREALASAKFEWKTYNKSIPAEEFLAELIQRRAENAESAKQIEDYREALEELSKNGLMVSIDHDGKELGYGQDIGLFARKVLAKWAKAEEKSAGIKPGPQFFIKAKPYNKECAL